MMERLAHHWVVLGYKRKFRQGTQHNEQKCCSKNECHSDLKKSQTTFALHHAGSDHVVKIEPMPDDHDWANDLQRRDVTLRIARHEQ